jgi:histone H3/H4
LEVLVELVYRGVLPYDGFIRVVRKYDQGRMSHEAPGAVAKAVNLMIVHSEDRELIREIVERLSPEARKLVNAEAVLGDR